MTFNIKNGPDIQEKHTELIDAIPYPLKNHVWWDIRESVVASVASTKDWQKIDIILDNINNCIIQHENECDCFTILAVLHCDFSDFVIENIMIGMFSKSSL